MYIICHYGEIGIKGKNRKFFEERLLKNIKQGLAKKMPGCFKFVKRISGRIIILLAEEECQHQEKIKQVLKNIFGIVHFSFAVNSEQEIKIIKENCLELLRDRKFKTFKISTQRSKKNFPLTSQKINERLGAFIIEKLKKKVDLENPDITCFVEIVENFAFIYLEKIEGLGGLPVGTNGKALALISGGIDSPLASFFTQKRGVEIIFLHFHAFPYTEKTAIEKVREIIKILNKYQFKSKLYLTPFADIQKEILLKAPEGLRVILYRRFMMRIAQEIIKKEQALAIVTGESIGQVASQTLENIKAIEEVTEIPVLRPLIGLDKEEIIQKAKKIGSYDISILPHQDCCARFLPRHPETRVKIEEIKKAEKSLNIKKLIKTSLDNTELEIIY